ncbi:hypothetical protein KDJ57_gp53 [Gordonia phage Catfish]|uniref:Uncharacterized protein n=1 Tax=Gordonia phage Catfish TaxID=2301538 RepID=A0A385D0L5_9CAUD|nr:hypothetical protein KDJ57_gp53 [Gordonia phage Catfish]AXQ51892.1 hypothetical protein SEA_CATFISH_56 [Gordonia phage Catfish]
MADDSIPEPTLQADEIRVEIILHGGERYVARYFVPALMSDDQAYSRAFILENSADAVMRSATDKVREALGVPSRAEQAKRDHEARVRALRTQRAPGGYL